jgi:hypothetical protein
VNPELDMAEKTKPNYRMNGGIRRKEKIIWKAMKMQPGSSGLKMS